MKDRILICVAARDRKRLTALSLENLAAVKGAGDVLAVFNDGSKEYDGAWLGNFADMVFNVSQPVNIHAQRRLHFQFAQKMFEHDPSFGRLYFTDADCLHDMAWRENIIRIQDANRGALVCGYNTTAHSCLEGNTSRDEPAEEVIWRKYAPGVSYLLTPDHVDVICGHLEFLLAGWDWEVPTLLGNQCAITRVGYVDHVGWGGDRHPADAGIDGGDRVINPTKFLIGKRAEVVAELQHDAARKKTD